MDDIPPPKIKIEYKKLTLDEDESNETPEAYKGNTFYFWKTIKRKIFGGKH